MTKILDIDLHFGVIIENAADLKSIEVMKQNFLNFVKCELSEGRDLKFNEVQIKIVDGE